MRLSETVPHVRNGFQKPYKIYKQFKAAIHIRMVVRNRSVAWERYLKPHIYITIYVYNINMVCEYRNLGSSAGCTQFIVRAVLRLAGSPYPPLTASHMPPAPG